MLIIREGWPSRHRKLQQQIIGYLTPRDIIYACGSDAAVRRATLALPLIEHSMTKLSFNIQLEDILADETGPVLFPPYEHCGFTEFN